MSDVPKPPTPGLSKLQLAALVLGLVITASTVLGGVTSIGARLAERDFMTLTVAKEREALLAKQFETRIATSEALAAQREAALVERIESMRKSQEEANQRMQTSIDRIYNLLLQRR